jgi:hypothetical protein
MAVWVKVFDYVRFFQVSQFLNMLSPPPSPSSFPASSVNKATAEAMLLIVSVLRLGEWPDLPTPLDDDSRLRMMQCLQVLAKPDPELVQVRCRKQCCMLFKESV